MPNPEQKTVFNPGKGYTRREGNAVITYKYDGLPGEEDINLHTYTIQKPGMRPTTITGLNAKAMAKNPDGSYMYNDISPEIRGTVRGTNDYRDSYSYGISSGLRKHFLNPDNPTIFNKAFSTPATASMSGAAIGALLGAGGNFVGKRMGLVDEDSDPLWWGLGLGALGAGLGYLSNKYSLFSNQSLDHLFKKASMWQDPRNFILEKLQRANDVNAIDKAILATKIRNMSTYQASDLEKLVRGALGIGVGAIIARFFGCGTFGTAVGAMAGLYGANAMGVGSSLF